MTRDDELKATKDLMREIATGTSNKLAELVRAKGLTHPTTRMQVARDLVAQDPEGAALIIQGAAILLGSMEFLEQAKELEE